MIALILLGCFHIHSTRADANSYAAPAGNARWTMVSKLTPEALNLDVDILIVPLFDGSSDNLLSSKQVADLNTRGVQVLCTVVVGYWNSKDPDSGDFSSSMKGSELWGDPNRRWIDIRNTGLWKIMDHRFALAKQIGCSGVVGIYLQTYVENTGFAITSGDQLAYNRRLADSAHSLGLSIGMYNANFQADELVNWYDFAVVESCLEAANCEDYLPFVATQKPVFDVEYNTMEDELDVCAAGRVLGFNSILKNVGDDIGFRSCSTYR